MDERFQNLIRQRHAKLAWLFLALFCTLMIVVDRFAYQTIGFADGRLMQRVSYSMLGLIAAQFVLLAIWTALGEGSLLRRLLFLVCALTAMVSTWILGVIDSFGNEHVTLHRREEIHLLGIVPVLLLSLCTPLIVLRRFFSRMLSLADKPTREPITTFGLMIVTAVVAICLATAQLPQLSGASPNESWIGITIYSSLSFLVGLTVILPTVLLLFSKTRNVYLWSLLLMLFVELLTLLVIYGISLIPKSSMRTQDIWPAVQIPAQIVGTAMLAVIIGILIMRLFGFRLQNANPQSVRIY